MKKIDLHIHTIATNSDPAFVFSLTKLKEYIDKCKIDCIAITNHNLFDLNQFNTITKSLGIMVLPGIEINLEKGHLLLISDKIELEDFEYRCNQITKLVSKPEDNVSFTDLQRIFPTLEKYMLIPHFDKKPSVSPTIIKDAGKYFSAGEVSSQKKFSYCIKDNKCPVPVIFSDLRITDTLIDFSPRQTFIDTDTITFKAIRTCLLDRDKVSLSKKGGHNFFQIFENGQVLSTGLNVILGERSSGKTVTLNRIEGLFERVKYIKQFELLERDEEISKAQFNSHLSTRQSKVTESYLSEFKAVVDDISKIDRNKNELELDHYLDSLLTVAFEEEKKDIYSQAVLFNESKFIEIENSSLVSLIDSVQSLIDNEEYKEIINTYITQKSLILLLLELMIKYQVEQELTLKKIYLNSFISDIKNELHSSSAISPIKEIDFYNILLEKDKINKFISIVNLIQTERTIVRKNVRRFQIVANTRTFNGAGELNAKCGKRNASFSNAFKNYDSPIDYLESLKGIPQLEEIDYFKYFVAIDYTILNEHQLEVSGGERSEFNLLDKIQDAYQYDLLLIDEPESSFDNLFLKNEVNEQIKEISKYLPVVIVTHNNTVGASINPNYILYTKREIIENHPIFKIFSGLPSDSLLKSIDGETISNYNIILNCLEAGDAAYTERRKSYDVLKN